MSTPDTRSRKPTSGTVGDAKFTPAFRWVFLSILGIAAACFIALIGLSLVPKQTATIQQTTETCSTVFKLCVGAIIGLISGKAI